MKIADDAQKGKADVILIDCDQMNKVKLKDFKCVDDVPIELKNTYETKMQVYYDFGNRKESEKIDEFTPAQLQILLKEHYK
jgi:hypothetical protein